MLFFIPVQASSIHFDCGGFEPSFSLKIREKVISYAAPDLEIANITKDSFKSEKDMILIDGKTPKGEQVSIKLKETKKCNSDGEGSKLSNYDLTAQIGKMGITGCCDIAKSK